MTTQSIGRLTSQGNLYDLADIQARIKLETLESNVETINTNVSIHDSKLIDLDSDLRKGTKGLCNFLPVCKKSNTDAYSQDKDAQGKELSREIFIVENEGW